MAEFQMRVMDPPDPLKEGCLRQRGQTFARLAKGAWCLVHEATANNVMYQWRDHPSSKSFEYQAHKVGTNGNTRWRIFCRYMPYRKPAQSAAAEPTAVPTTATA